MRPEPRGSKFSILRRPSSLFLSQSRCSNRVLPGGTGTPPTMTLVGLPSVCESTVRTDRVKRCGMAVPGFRFNKKYIIYYY